MESIHGVNWDVIVIQNTVRSLLRYFAQVCDRLDVLTLGMLTCPAKSNRVTLFGGCSYGCLS